MPSLRRIQRARLKHRKKPPQPGDPPDIILIGRIIRNVASIFVLLKDIAEAAEGNDCASEPLRRLSAISKSFWIEIKLLPIVHLPSIYHSVETYHLILQDFRLQASSNTLSPNDVHNLVQGLESSFDNFKTTVNWRHSPVSPSSQFFTNAHDFEINGGQFTITTNTIDDGASLLLQNKIRQDVRHIKLMVAVLFSPAGHRWL